MAYTSREMRRYNHLLQETDAVYHDMAQHWGLSDSVMGVLYTLCDAGGRCRLRDICYWSGMTKQTVNSALRRMEGDGLIYLEAAGRGSILIPSPIVTGNHQLHNANVLGDAGSAVVIEQKDASPERIIAEVERLYADRERLTEMGHKAKSLEIADTDDRIWNVVAQLYQKAKSK